MNTNKNESEDVVMDFLIEDLVEEDLEVCEGAKWDKFKSVARGAGTGAVYGLPAGAPVTGAVIGALAHKSVDRAFAAKAKRVAEREKERAKKNLEKAKKNLEKAKKWAKEAAVRMKALK